MLLGALLPLQREPLEVSWLALRLFSKSEPEWDAKISKKRPPDNDNKIKPIESAYIRPKNRLLENVKFMPNNSKNFAQISKPLRKETSA